MAKKIKKAVRKNAKKKSRSKSTAAKKKKVAKRKSAKKSATKKAKTKAKKRRKAMQYIGLQAKKLQILREVPVMPCSALMKDRDGVLIAYTRATEVFNIYRQKLEEQNLSTTVDKCKSETVLTEERITTRPDGTVDHYKKYSSRTHIRLKIKDNETGEEDLTEATALGDNFVWSDNSSNTIAKKQALLMYFETAWPQPLDHVEVVRDSLSELPPTEFKKAVMKMMPLKYMTNKGAAAALESYFKKQFGI
jgi:hypothetical protein